MIEVRNDLYVRDLPEYVCTVDKTEQNDVIIPSRRVSKSHFLFSLLHVKSNHLIWNLSPFVNWN